MRRIRFLAVPLAAWVASAFAGGLEDAKAFLDRSAPGDCETLMMQYEAQSLPAGSQAQLGALGQVRRRLSDRERDGVADRIAFDAARAKLTPAERTQLESHAASLYTACAERVQATFHVQLPAAPAKGAARIKAAPYAPPMEKSKQGAAERPAALESSSVNP